MRLQRASNKLPLRLARELGRGGEGAVYSLENAPNLVAKVYRRPPGAAKSEKLRSMVRRATAQLMRVAAWPMDVLLDEQGAAVGFLMRKVSAREDIHELYSPKSRRQKFPNADFRFVVRVATNLARAFGQVHALGNVIGDVNHGNALVGRDGTVVLIDCDSIQIRDGSRIHTCDVGVPLFTPPELQGRSFRALRRTADHDAFGLAVLIFHLLYLGRHPFAGLCAHGDIPIERAIAQARFVYGTRAGEFGMTAPPNTLPLNAFGARIAALFEQSFAPPGEAARAGAGEWIAALQDLEADLTTCAARELHFHRAGQSCCWCEIESRSGLKVFGNEIPDPDSLALFRVEQLWDAILAEPAPDPSPPAATPRVLVNLPPVRAFNARRASATGTVTSFWLPMAFAAFLLAKSAAEYWWLSVTVFIAAAAVRIIQYGLTHDARENRKVLREMSEAEERWKSLLGIWHRNCTDERFHKVRQQLEAARDQLKQLPAQRNVALNSIRESRGASQRKKYLDHFRIDAASFPEIAPEEIAALADHGIWTAGDFLEDASKLLSKPKLRKILKRGTGMTLQAWASSHAKAFELVPPEPLDPEAVKRVSNNIEAHRDRLIETLRFGPSMLRSKRDEILDARKTWGPLLDSAWADLDVTRDRARFVPRA